MLNTQKSKPEPGGYFLLLKHNRNFRWLWSGEIISQMGDWFNLIAIMALLLRLTGSASSAGWIIIIRSLPYFFIGPFAGVVADRFNRKTVMILSDVLRALVVLSFLLVKQPGDVWIIYTATTLEMIASAFFSPAKSAVIPNVVDKDDLISANALSSITWSVMLTVGAVLGGLVSGAWGHQTCFIINSISYLVSAYCIYRTQIPVTLKRIGNLISPFKEFLNGLSYVRHKQDTFAYIWIKTGWGISSGILLVITVLGQKVYPISGNADTGIGVLYAARGLGTALGPVVARKLCNNSQPQMRQWVGYSFVIGALFVFGITLSTNLWMVCMMIFLAHCGTSILWVFSSTLLQLNTTDAVRGRVFATEWALFTLAMSCSNYLTGYGLDRMGYSITTMLYILAGTLFVPGLIWILLAWNWAQWMSWQKKEPQS